MDCRRILVTVHRSAGDKLAVDSLILLVWDWVLFLQRERKCLANCFQSKICGLVSGKLPGANSPSVYIYTVICTSQLHLRLTSVFLLSSLSKQLLHRKSLITRNAKEYRSIQQQNTIIMNKCHKIYQSGRFEKFCFTSP